MVEPTDVGGSSKPAAPKQEVSVFARMSVGGSKHPSRCVFVRVD